MDDAQGSINGDGSLAVRRNGPFVRPSEPLATDTVVVRAVDAAKEGDQSALHFLYVRYADDVYRYVNGIVQDSYEAEDITQNVFAKLMTAILKYEQRDVPFTAWILRVARNVALDHIRARRIVPFEEVRVSDELDEQTRVERYHCLRDALEGLPREQREVLVLRHIGGLSPTEIAERLHKSEASIHGLHHRGRGALTAALAVLDATPVTASA
jgi:RNA polymerase sigma-70 factor (ECF subfamily)